jgi:hypothetical protein
MTITISLWTIAFILSFIINILLVLYARFLLTDLVSTSAKIVELNNEVISFSSHLKSIYELEAFYGEPALEGLLKHALHITEKFEEFDNSISFEEEEEEEDDNNDEETDQTNSQTITRQQELFYGGTRKGDS